MSVKALVAGARLDIAVYCICYTNVCGYGIVYRRNTDNMTIPYKLIATSPELNLVPQSNILYLYAHVDADHGRDIYTRHTVTAYVLPCWFLIMLEVQT